MAWDIEFKEIHRKRKKHRKKHYLVRLAIVAGTIAVIVAFLFSPLFEIKKIDVRGNSYYSDQEVINMSGATKGKNLIFQTGAKRIKNNLSGNPYFSNVTVGRNLPSTLVINVHERSQVACIKYGSSYIIISVEGEVLRKTEVDPKITLLSGLTLSSIKVGKTVAAEEEATLKTTLDMVNTMRKGDLYFKKIKMSDRYIRAYIYDTLVVKGKPDLVKKSINEGKLQKVVNKLYQNKIKRGTITVGTDNYLSFSPAI